MAAVLAVAFIGFLDAAYLTAKRYLGEPLQCYFFGGCDTVSASPYSVFLGIPLSLYGAIFYVAVVLLAVLYIQTKHPRAAQTLMLFAFAGFALSAYFTYLQAFVIRAFCIYCVVSAVASTFVFILMLVAWQQYLRKPPLDTPTASA